MQVSYQSESKCRRGILYLPRNIKYNYKIKLPVWQAYGPSKILMSVSRLDSGLELESGWK